MRETYIFNAKKEPERNSKRGVGKTLEGDQRTKDFLFATPHPTSLRFLPPSSLRPVLSRCFSRFKIKAKYGKTKACEQFANSRQSVTVLFGFELNKVTYLRDESRYEGITIGGSKVVGEIL